MTGVLAALLAGGPGAKALAVNASGNSLYPADAYAYGEYRSDGTVHKGETPSGDSTVGTWLLSGSASSYEIRVTGTGDTPTSGEALNTWYSLSVSRSWTLTQTAQGQLDFNGTVEIRLAGGAVISSASFNLSALSDI